MNKRQWVAVRILVSLSLSGAATSQILPPPPEHPQYDENGVDVQARMHQFVHQGVSIGPANHRGLSYTKYVSGDVWRDSYSSMLYVAIQNNISSEVAHFGNKGESFNSSFPANGMGSGVSSSSYSLRDGTTINYGNHGFGYSDPEALSTYNWSYADSVEYPDGVRLDLHYRDAVGGAYGLTYTRLQSVTSNTGYQLKYYYQTDTLTSAPESPAQWWTVTRVVAINNAIEYCDPIADSCNVSNTWPQAQYAYAGNTYRLTDAAGIVTVNGGSATYAIETPNGTTNNRTYTTGSYFHPDIGTVYGITQANIDGKITTYDFSYSSGNHTSTVNTYGPLADNRAYVANWGESGVISFKNALNYTSQFTHDAFNRLKSATSPEGNRTEFVYDNENAPWYTRGNITLATAYAKPGSGLAPLSESWVFPSTCTNQKTCNKPETYTDPRGAVTSYTYDPQHGGKLRETLPADVNGIQPVKRYNYAQRSAWLKNAGGSYVQASPIWVLTSERTCQASATVGDSCALGDEIVTTYDYGPDYGPNNLLLRGVVVTAGGQSRRTCYAYNVLGDRISETRPRAGLATCP